MAQYAAQYYGKPATWDLKRRFEWELGGKGGTGTGRKWSAQAQTEGWRPIDIFNDPKVPPALRARMLDVWSRNMQGADLARRRADGTADITPGIPGKTLGFQSGPPQASFEDDVQARYKKQWEDFYADKKWYTDKQGWGDSPFAPAPLTKKQQQEQRQQATITDRDQSAAGNQLKGQTGEKGKIIKIGGRTYKLNKNGAWVDWTDPKNRERVTTKGAKKSLSGKKKND